MTKKEIIDEDLFDKATKNASIDVYIISGKRIIDRIRVKDIGQKFVLSKKLNRAFVLPDRTEGLSYGFKTLFFYRADMITPLTEDDKNGIDEQNETYLFGIHSENKITKFKARMTKNQVHLTRYNEKTKKIEPLVFHPTTMDSDLLKSLIETKTITELIKTPENIFEELKIPIIVGCIALVIIVMLFTI